MRFNKQELITLASLPSNKFEKEGILFITEKQEGFFRKTEGHLESTGENNPFKTQKPSRRKTLSCIGGTGKVSFPRWCRLRGNLFFYLKDEDQFSAPVGVIVLENCRPAIRSQSRDLDGFAFFLEFKDGLCQRIATNTETERTDWMQAMQLASYVQMNRQLKYLREQIDKKLGGSSYNRQDVATVRQQVGKEIDITEVPCCESAISCDNLLCDGHGRQPNPSVVIEVEDTTRQGWIKYGRTEVIERCSNPQFLCTIAFRASDGLNISSIIRFTVYDVREKVSRTSVPLGFAEIALGVIQDTTRLRIPLKSVHGNPGFITIASWSPERDKKTPSSPAKIVEQQNLGHRRSQSLPPKLGVKLFVPSQGKLSLVFANPVIHTYRLNSGLGGDISVQEILMESQLCYLIPQQLLSIWILREKELLQEISGMGELGGEWRHKQMDLLDKHLKLLKDYSQAKQNLQQYNNNNDKFYKPSANKTDDSLEFVPVNLHLQRMWAHNDTLKRSGILDIITVGAFTRHSGKSKTGGLIKLLQQTKDSPSKMDQNCCKVQTANDAVQAIKQLRKEIVEIMSQLLCLAKSKNPKGMLPLCNEMISKTRTLLNIWEPSLVEEAFEFIEQHRILEEPDNSLTPMSPFKKITQQLGALDLKSPDLEDFATPMGAPPDLWPKIRSSINIKTPTNSSSLRMKSPSATDINTISSIQNSVKIYNYQSRINLENTQPSTVSDIQQLSHSLPTTTYNVNENNKKPGSKFNEDDSGLKFNETHFDVNGDISTCESQPNSLILVQCTDSDSDDKPKLDQNKNTTNDNDMISNDSENEQQQTNNELAKSKNEILYNSADFDENGYIPTNCSIILGHNGAFLDTKAMCSSPSANYYRPTEEPEPLDLTQLNIEASVMCLVSKVKFLCGRCGSPAVRLRQPRNSVKRGFNNPHPDIVTSQPIGKNNCTVADSNNSQDQDQLPNVISSGQSLNISITPGAGGASENTLQIGVRPINIASKELNLALTQAVGEVTRRVKKGNKFTDGLDLSLTTDWASELRPSMRKLRQAMDGLLKTARLMHSVQRLQQDMKRISTNLAIMYRRDVCFAQALTSLVSGLMAKLWGTTITENYIEVLTHLGPLAYFEGLLSLYGNETDMWGDMCIAIEDLSAVNFTLIRSNIQRETKTLPVPRVLGSRQSLTVLLPIPETVYCIMPTKEAVTFKATAVFFNIGINERATLSETLGYSREQHRSNWDNFDRLKQYHIRYKKLNLVIPDTPSKIEHNVPAQTVADYLNLMEENLRANAAKNVKILHLAEDICRSMNGVRFTSCKSAKDRTGMAVTLEQCRILQQEFHLPSGSVNAVLNTMRSEGTRVDNIVKNIGKRKFAFNLPQVLSLPAMYRPPTGSYGKAQS